MSDKASGPSIRELRRSDSTLGDTSGGYSQPGASANPTTNVWLKWNVADPYADVPLPSSPPSLLIFPAHTDAREGRLARGAPAPIQYGPRRSRTRNAPASRQSVILGPFLFLRLRENRTSISPFVQTLRIAPLISQPLKVAPKTETVPVRAPFRPESEAVPVAHQVAELRRLTTKNFRHRDMSHGIPGYPWG